MISKVQKRFWYFEMWFHFCHYIDLQCFQRSIWQGRNIFPNTATTLADLGESADLKSHVQCVNLLGQTFPKSHNHNLFFYSFNNSWLTYCNHPQKLDRDVSCIPCSLGSNCDFLTVRSKGESWSAMRSLLSTGFWALAPAVDEATGDAFSRLWFFVLLGELESWVELVFEVYSAANCRIIRCMISRATKEMLGSETLELSKRHKIWNSNIQKKCKTWIIHS